LVKNYYWHLRVTAKLIIALVETPSTNLSESVSPAATLTDPVSLQLCCVPALGPSDPVLQVSGVAVGVLAPVPCMTVMEGVTAGLPDAWTLAPTFN
jgi:hypothetical protein